MTIIDSDIFKSRRLAESYSDTRIPGRADVRISLTARCNLRCTHCHNEGQTPPWENTKNSQEPSLSDIVDLLSVAHQYGARSVKFTGGDPSVYSNFFDLMRSVSSFRSVYTNIKQWGISTNGILFLKKRYFDALADSYLDNICIGIDSVEQFEFSKPNSDNGIQGIDVLERFALPLRAVWKERKIKINTVYSGNFSRTLGVIDSALEAKMNVSVIEINNVTGTIYDVRKGFFELINEVAVRYKFTPYLDHLLNEIHLRNLSGRSVVKFYQDHCVDLDCAHCRNIHMRFVYSSGGWASIPCFLREPNNLFNVTVGSSVDSRKFKAAIAVNGVCKSINISGTNGK
jgi:molybdenum cofactor biosynthesis enzyme MoaA